MTMSSSSIGVCSWCVDRMNPARAIETIARVFGAGPVQVGFFCGESYSSASLQAIEAAATQTGGSIVATFVAFEGEDYSSAQRLAATGGLLPDSTYDARLEATLRATTASASLGASSLTIHAGTIPDSTTLESYVKLLGRVRSVADEMDKAGVRLLLETGRESATSLNDFLDGLNHENIGVSFDPGNFVFYGTDDPVRAVVALKRRIGMVHLKDSVGASATMGSTGRFVPLGSGEAQIPRVLSKLRIYGYPGPLMIETSSSMADEDTVRNALAYVRTMIE